MRGSANRGSLYRWQLRLLIPITQNYDTQLLRTDSDTLIITRVSEVIMFSPCVFVTLFVCLFVCLSLSRCLTGRFNYEGLVPHNQYFAGTLLGMSSCASYVLRTHDVIDDVIRSENRSNFKSNISPLIYISINIWVRASIKSSKCRKCSWLSFWSIQLPV